MACQGGCNAKTRGILELDKALSEKKNLEILLCSACASLEQVGHDFKTNPALDQWWEKHQEEDRARALEEATKKRNDQIALEILNLPIVAWSEAQRKFLIEHGYLKDVLPEIKAK